MAPFSHHANSLTYDYRPEQSVPRVTMVPRRVSKHTGRVPRIPPAKDPRRRLTPPLLSAVFIRSKHFWRTQVATPVRRALHRPTANARPDKFPSAKIARQGRGRDRDHPFSGEKQVTADLEADQTRRSNPALRSQAIPGARAFSSHNTGRRRGAGVRDPERSKVGP
jgi:hypothetical protein